MSHNRGEDTDGGDTHSNAKAAVEALLLDAEAVQALYHEQVRKRMEDSWAELVAEFEGDQSAYGTRIALSNFVFQIVVAVSTTFIPGCHGLIVNDGSDNVRTAIKDMIARGEAGLETIKDSEVIMELPGVSRSPVPRQRPAPVTS